MFSADYGSHDCLMQSVLHGGDQFFFSQEEFGGDHTSVHFRQFDFGGSEILDV